MTVPQISVLMSVCNGQRYVPHAVKSILVQSLGDFEFIIVDDGSTDGTPTILDSFDDSRIVRIRNKENLGLTRSLNKGLGLAQGEFIARMDADDIALPNRFSEQVAFLGHWPDVGILGSAYEIIDEQGRSLGCHPMPRTDLEIRWACFLENPFAHPTVMIRQNVLARNGLNYDERFQTAQDYHLWWRVLRNTRGANLEKVLVRYRLSGGQSGTHRDDQLTNHDRISWAAIRKGLPGLDIEGEDVACLRKLFAMGDEETSGVRERKIVLANLYLDMLQQFVDQYENTAELKKFKRQVAVKVARTVLHRPLQKGWGALLRRLSGLAPAILFLHLFGWARRRGPRQPDSTAGES